MDKFIEVSIYRGRNILINIADIIVVLPDGGYERPARIKTREGVYEIADSYETIKRKLTNASAEIF